MAKRLERGEATNGTAEIVAGDFQIVSSAWNSRRPRSLRRPERTMRKRTTCNITTRCPMALRRRRKEPPEPPIELDALQIRTPERWSFLRRRVASAALGAVAGRSPAAKQHRRGIEHCDPRCLVVLLALVLHSPRDTGRGADSRPDRAAGCRRDGAASRSRRAVARTRGAAGHRRGAGDRGDRAARGFAI